jgi:hypothetical protein
MPASATSRHGCGSNPITPVITPPTRNVILDLGRIRDVRNTSQIDRDRRPETYGLLREAEADLGEQAGRLQAVPGALPGLRIHLGVSSPLTIS